MILIGYDSGALAELSFPPVRCRPGQASGGDLVSPGIPGEHARIPRVFRIPDRKLQAAGFSESFKRTIAPAWSWLLTEPRPLHDPASYFL
jgi:hypothetical protein